MLSNIAKTGFRRLMSTSSPLIREELYNTKTVKELWNDHCTKVLKESLVATGKLTTVFVASSLIVSNLKIERPWYIKGDLIGTASTLALIGGGAIPGRTGHVFRGACLYSMALFSGLSNPLSLKKFDATNAALNVGALAGGGLVAATLLRRYKVNQLLFAGITALVGGIIIVPLTVGFAEAYAKQGWDFESNNLKYSLDTKDSPITTSLMMSSYEGVFTAWGIERVIAGWNSLSPQFFFFTVIERVLVNIFGKDGEKKEEEEKKIEE